MKRKQTTSISTKPTRLRSKGEQPRSRTFTGCRTCRSRHLKCDEARPSCSTCRRLNITCDGYAPSLLWMTEQGTLDDQKGTSYRYPLFDETERACMSVELVESLGRSSAGRVVTDLDNESVDGDELHSVGPFGVFRAIHRSSHEQILRSSLSPAPAPVEAEIDTQLTADDTLLPQHHDQHPLDGFSFPIPDDDEVIQLPSEPWSLDPSLDLGQLPVPDLASEIEEWMRLGTDVGNGSLMSLSFDASGMNFIISPRASPRVSPRASPRASPRPRTPAFQGLAPTPSRLENEAMSRVVTEIARPLTTSIETLPTHTPLLLRHLKEQVLEGSPAMAHRLSPWKVLFLPRALETFAEMSLWNTSSFTRRSILSSLLSKSAYHLHKSDKNDRSTQWLSVASAHMKEAQEHLKSALASEFWGDNQAEYTEMLMALLGVGFAKLHFDGPAAVKKLLFDAERLIRLRGIPSYKRYAQRVLHHMYTHLRVIAESTSFRPTILAAQSVNPSAADMSPEYNAALVLQGFRLDESNLGDLDHTREKALEVGYNDIHLEVSGHWQATLYPEMYGVPESLMTLLSQTISLANEKPKLEVAALSSPATSVALSQHTRTLEQQIWSWVPSSTELPIGPGRPETLVQEDTPVLDKPDARSMVLAIHQALIIFFYRRVYNMNAWIVQDQVRKTLDYLQPHAGIDTYDQDFAITIGWSCFIASCEAATPELQQRGLKLLQAMDGSGVFVETEKPSVIAQSVWEQRNCSGDMTYSWPDVMLQMPHISAAVNCTRGG